MAEKKVLSTTNDDPIDSAEQSSIVGELIRGQTAESYKRYGLSQDDIDKSMEIALGLTQTQAISILKRFLDEHGDDMLIANEITENVKQLVHNLETAGDDEKANVHSATEARIIAAVFDSDSVYPEIRASFPNTDDPEIPCGTIRAWAIGLIWSVGIAALNQFFAPRNPSITVSAYVAQLFAYYMGIFCEKFLPSRVFFSGTRFAFSLNPGPFSLKEHMLITIMANVTNTIYSYTGFLFVQRLDVYFGHEWAGEWGYQICITLFLMLFGFSLAGFVRRFLVYPPQMIYYSVISQAALNLALHSRAEEETTSTWKMSRLKFFMITFGAMFLYYWLPGVIFPTLTFFNWTTWIRPENAVLSIITGSYYFNLGLNPVFPSFDWNWFASVINPMIIPFFIVFQIVISLLTWAVFVIIPVFFKNIWYTAYIPINSWYAYDNTGEEYDASRIMTSSFTFNQTAYEEYSPIFFPAAFILRDAILLATLTGSISFCALWYGKNIWRTAKILWKRETQYAGFSDIHARLMSKYAEVPESWYLIIGAIAAGFGFAAIYAWPTGTPGWVIPVTLVLSGLLIVPLGVIQAVSSYQPTLEILFELVGGFVCKNNPSAFLIFHFVGVAVSNQALTFTQDMKLGHYMKIPPHQMFMAQVVSTAVSCLVVVSIIKFQLNIEGVCNSEVQTRWICGTASTNFTSSLMWGLIGPTRLFTHVGAMYWKIMLALLAGALWPLPWFFGRKMWPGSFFRYAHPIVMMLGGVLWAPMNLSMFWQSLMLAWVFGVWVKSRFPDWWNKYVFVLGASLTTGVAVASLVQFFAITNADVTVPDWWGTTQYYSTCDFQDCRYLTVAEGETFGPKEWH
ncbi:hypothetical protein N7493_006760 [Penicillium malachiteum]|uniref:Uncharacterized protein n=1 Tax=Penicillium malachiteum TaxID=1324776 RepID=A0AAD6HJN7_9EURO|nr:hypothetical protein N7493_006760 [Penicillium malachiteum]